MSNSTKGITMIIDRFHDHIFLRSPKGPHCLNPMKYHGSSIENTCCYQPSSIVYDHFRVSPIGQSFLLILTQG